MLRSVPARKGFARAFRIANDLLRRSEKHAEIQFEGAEEPVDCETARDLNMPLIHLFRNAFSHGIEDPAIRIAKGKPGRGTVKVSVRHAGHNLVIGFSDDGRGLDPEQLRNAAIQKGHVTHDEAAALSENEFRMLIFRPGFTTSDAITNVSGRGVGLDAVMAAVKNLDGYIEIDPDTTTGLGFIITIPESGIE
jgi:two-component system chemotaxis sensor kinase CheA